MFNRLKSLIAAPVFADEEATRLAGLLTVILRATFVAALVLTSTLTLLEPGNDPLPRLALGAVAAVMILGLFVLMRTGRVRLVSVLMPSGLLAVVTASLVQFGDIQGPVVGGYYVVIVVAGLLLGAQGSFAFTLFSMLATLGVLLVSVQGAPLNSPEVVTELQAWFVHAGLFSVTAVLLSVAAGNIREGLETARRLFAEMRRRAAQLSLLEEVSRQVAGTLDEQEIFQRTVTAIVNRFGFAEAAISLSVGGDQLELVAITGTEDLGFNPGFRQKVGEGIIGHVAETRAIYLTNDVGHDAYYFSSPGRQVGSALGLPMLREGQLMGVLYVESSAPGAFETDDVRTLETLANHIATALQNARLYARARDRLREMTALQSVSHTVASSLELSQIFQTVVQLLQDTFGYHYVSIYRLDGEVLRLGAQVGYPAELIYYEIPITTGITGRTARTRQTQFVDRKSVV